jgi:hypothetical protein
MVQEISTPVVLDHSNIVIGSEIVTIKGASISALIRDVDYIMDYPKGELKFLTSGAAVQYGSLIEQNGIDINYSYAVDFSNPDLFESQLEVFDEVAKLVQDFRISVSNSPINSVSRVFNQTTQEEYEVSYIHNNEIILSGTTPPRTQFVELAATTKLETVFDSTILRHKNLFALIYPSNFKQDLNPVFDFQEVRSFATYATLAIIGGQETLSQTLTFSVPYETTDIRLSTGARSLRQSNSYLIYRTDFTFSFVNTTADSDYKTLTVNILPSGVSKIRTNNLYLYLGFSENFEYSNNQFTTTTLHVNERVSFVDDQATLTLIPRTVEIGPVADSTILPKIQVVDPTSKVSYEEGVDYNISFVQRKITKTTNSRIQQQAIIYYIEDRTLQASFDLVSDVVLVDYIWGNNSLNWEPLQKQVLITQNATLIKNAQFITLSDIPEDYTKILMYKSTDTFKRPVMVPISFNPSDLRLHFGPPIPTESSYTLEYNSIKQPIREGTSYFVTYKYGATRDVLKDKFAQLLGITNTQTYKEEVIALASGSRKTQLSRSPVDISTVEIYVEGDAQQAAVATPLSYDGTTKILTFTPISSSGRYVFRYLTDGFDTKNLRAAVSKLFETFKDGPTLAAFENIISGFVETPPEITSRLTDRFILPNEEKTIGNEIALSAFQASPALEDGTPSIEFIPARFNLGALIERSKEGYIKGYAANNFGVQEGTLEFLAGFLFEGVSDKYHYFFDLGTENKNRFSLYKYKNRLNFDIWDSKGQLFRTAADVNQIYHTEIIELKAGASQATLTYDSTAARLDFDDNQTPDLYDGLETKFIIMPETPTFPESYKKASIKVLSYNAATRLITFEPVDYSGRYIFSYIGGIVKFEETETFIAVTWKLHTHDAQSPFYRLYINGRKVINQTLQDIGITTGESDQSLYDEAEYDIDVYEETE